MVHISINGVIMKNERLDQRNSMDFSSFPTDSAYVETWTWWLGTKTSKNVIYTFIESYYYKSQMKKPEKIFEKRVSIFIFFWKAYK